MSANRPPSPHEADPKGWAREIVRKAANGEKVSRAALQMARRALKLPE